MNRGNFILPIAQSKYPRSEKTLIQAFKNRFNLHQRNLRQNITAPIKIWYQKWGQSYVCANIQQKDMYFLND